MDPELKAALELLTKTTGDKLGAMQKLLDDERKEREELERKWNRERISGGRPQFGRGTGDAMGLAPDERKSLESAVRALVRGDQKAANQAFAQAIDAGGLQEKAMQVGVDLDGGYLVHPQTSIEMTKVQTEAAPMLADVRTIPMNSSDAFEEPVDKDAAGASWVGETEARGDSKTPGLGLFTAPLHEICAQPKVSQKLIDTTSVDVLRWLTEKVGEAFGLTIADALINGNGVAKPMGILSYPSAATPDKTRAWGTLQYIATGASGAFKAAGSDPADCLIETVASLKAQYRAGAKWYMNRQTEAAVRKLKDSQGRYLLVDSLVPGQPPTLLGYPVVQCEQLGDPAANSFSIIFGNLKKGYTSPQLAVTRFLTDPYTDKPNVKLYAYQRIGGGVNNSEALKLVKFGTT